MKYARQCSITGEGMNEGFCIQDGQMYVKHESDLTKHLEANTDYTSTQEAYDDGYCYYTEWECDDDLQYEEINGVLTEINTL